MTTYVQSTGNSDLSGSPSNWKKDILTSGASSGKISFSVAASSTETDWFVTASGIPGSSGPTIADYVVKVNITTGSTNSELSVKVNRVNSSGTVQTSSSATAEQTETAGVKTFTLSAANLGTWAAGDRLRVDMIHRNPAVMTNANLEYDVGGGTDDTVVVTSIQTLTPSLFTDDDTFYSHTITVGSVTLSPSLFTDDDTFYAHTITVGAVTLSPSLFTDDDTFYSATVTTGAVTLSPSLYEDADAFYSPTVTVGAVTLEPSLFEDGDTFYAATVEVGDPPAQQAGGGGYTPKSPFGRGRRDHGETKRWRDDITRELRRAAGLEPPELEPEPLPEPPPAPAPVGLPAPQPFDWTTIAPYLQGMQAALAEHQRRQAVAAALAYQEILRQDDEDIAALLLAA